MNRFPYAAAVVSVIVTLVLGYVIKTVNDDPSWLPVEPDGSSATPAAEPGAAVAASPSVFDCVETENSLRSRIETARYCTTDDDCTLFDFGYPIDCMTSVAKSDITDLRLEYTRYEESCNFRVYFDCPAEPMERRAVCEQNRCTVSLHTIDVLEEETRDYLGIGSSGQDK